MGHTCSPSQAITVGLDTGRSRLLEHVIILLVVEKTETLELEEKEKEGESGK